MSKEPGIKPTHDRQSAARWREIADARERIEISEFRERQQRVNDDLWLHADAPPPLDSDSDPELPINWWWVACVCICVMLLLWSGYVLSCGASGMCGR